MPSHQVWLASESYGLVHLHEFYYKISSPSGIAKHERRCTQFADSATKFAGGAQFVQNCIAHIIFEIFYVRTLVQNELNLPEITF